MLHCSFLWADSIVKSCWLKLKPTCHGNLLGAFQNKRKWISRIALLIIVYDSMPYFLRVTRICPTDGAYPNHSKPTGFKHILWKNGSNMKQSCSVGNGGFDHILCMHLWGGAMYTIYIQVCPYMYIDIYVYV